MNVSLTDEFRDFLRQKVESGEFPSEEAVWHEAVRRFGRAEPTGDAAGEASSPEDPIDHDAISHCAREIAGKDVPSIEEVRRILLKVPGSMAQAVADEREERS